MKTLKLIFQTFRDLIIRFLPQFMVKFLMKQKGEFAFLVHPRNISDILKKYPFAKFFPEWFLKILTRLLWPIIASQITGLKKIDGQEVKGWIIICPMTAEQMMKNRKLAKKRILQSVKLAEKIGARIIGLGALTSSLTNRGLDLIDKVKIGLTTGNSYTVAITIESIERIAKKKKIDLNAIQIAVVGATGSIGQLVSKILAQRISRLILIGRTPEHLSNLAVKIQEINNKIKIQTSINIYDIKSADFVVVATSAAGALIKAEYLKQGAIVYDITQPQNVCPEIMKERKDVLIIDGGLVKTPGINLHVNLGLPKQELAFACLAETMILGAEGKFDHYSLDNVRIEQIQEIKQLGEKYKFDLADFYSFGKIIEI